MLSFAKTRHSSNLGFRKWIELENHKKLIAEAVEGGDFPKRVIDYLSTAFGDKGWDKKPYKEVLSSLSDGFQQFNPDTSLPILNAPKSNKELDWDYKGRTWNYFSHLLANAYGWTLEYIAELDVNEALGHIQEILTSEFLEQEFYHSLSEVAFVYNKATKKSDYKPLQRPYWMRPAAKPLRKFKIPKSLLPIGVGVDVSGLPEEYGIQKIIEYGNNPSGNTQTVPPPS